MDHIRKMISRTIQHLQQYVLASFNKDRHPFKKEVFDINGNTGTLVLTPDQYVAKIEAGPGKDSSVVSIEPLEIPNMILVGSILLEYVYPVFIYETTGQPGSYELKPKEVWLFNVKGGPEVIQ